MTNVIVLFKLQSSNTFSDQSHHQSLLAITNPFKWLSFVRQLLSFDSVTMKRIVLLKTKLSSKNEVLDFETGTTFFECSVIEIPIPSLDVNR